MRPQSRFHAHNISAKTGGNLIGIAYFFLEALPIRSESGILLVSWFGCQKLLFMEWIGDMHKNGLLTPKPHFIYTERTGDSYV